MKRKKRNIMLADGSATQSVDEPMEFRFVLGQYPTGVTLITAAGVNGSRVGMIVGSFVSVSLEPQLVGFFVDKKSTSWPLIAEIGSFCANILTSQHLEVCRAFVRKSEDRFDISPWDVAPSGSPKLAEAAAWIDCDVESVSEAGDHWFVLGRVGALGTGAPERLPLLFLRGGYGSFTVPSLESPSLSLTRFVRAIEVSRPIVEDLSEELELGCLVNGVVHDKVIVLFAAGLNFLPAGAESRVGLTFDLAAPIAPIHVAWQGAEEEKLWVRRGLEILGPVDMQPAYDELERVRLNGFAFTTGIDETAVFEETVANSGDALLLDLHNVLPNTLRQAARSATLFEDAEDVTGIHIPVFDDEGRVRIGLTITGFSGSESITLLRARRDAGLKAAHEIQRALRGSLA